MFIGCRMRWFCKRPKAIYNSGNFYNLIMEHDYKEGAMGRKGNDERQVSPSSLE